MGHGISVADVYKHGSTCGHFPSTHRQVIHCDCRTITLDRQAVHVCRLLRSLRALGIKSTLFCYDYLPFRIKFTSTAGVLLAGAWSDKSCMKTTCILFRKLRYPVQEELVQLIPGIQPVPELPNAFGSERAYELDILLPTMPGKSSA